MKITDILDAKLNLEMDHMDLEHSKMTIIEELKQLHREMEEDAEQSGDITEDQLIGKLEREMRAAAERLDFERAAQIRDRILQLHNPTN